RSFDGKAVESSDKLQGFVAQTPPKKSVKVELLRDRKSLILTLTIGERPESADTGEEAAAPSEKKGGKETEKNWHGAHVSALTQELAENYRQPSDAAGVVVTDVEPGSQAEEMALEPGDV